MMVQAQIKSQIGSSTAIKEKSNPYAKPIKKHTIKIVNQTINIVNFSLF